MIGRESLETTLRNESNRWRLGSPAVRRAEHYPDVSRVSASRGRILEKFQSRSSPPPGVASGDLVSDHMELSEVLVEVASDRGRVVHRPPQHAAFVDDVGRPP